MKQGEDLKMEKLLKNEVESIDLSVKEEEREVYSRLKLKLDRRLKWMRRMKESK